MATETRWNVGDEVWGRFFDLATNNYVARLVGHVTGVGALGFTLRRVRPDHAGRLIERHPHGVVGLWASMDEAEAWIAAHPFDTGIARRLGG